MELKSGITLIAEVEGRGPPAGKGDRVTVRLNGWLNGGEMIQRDYVGDIVIGNHGVIAGIEYALIGMRPGGRRTVRISPHLGYKSAGIAGRIPADAVLVYEIEVLEIEYKS
jgi:FKBP-type peptidyl-prolyl cis-trans isomerase FkpA